MLGIRKALHIPNDQPREICLERIQTLPGRSVNIIGRLQDITNVRHPSLSQYCGFLKRGDQVYLAQESFADSLVETIDKREGGRFPDLSMVKRYEISRLIVRKKNYIQRFISDLVFAFYRHRAS
jgi:hypothetical protein